MNIRNSIRKVLYESSWEEQDRIENELYSLVQKANEYLISHSNKRIHSSKSNNIKLDNRVYEQFVGPKPEGLWYSFGNSWVSILEDYPEWLSPYFYEVIGIDPFVIDDNEEDFLLYNDKGDEWAWDEIQDTGKNSVEVRSPDLVEKYLPNWWAPSGCVWNLNEVKLIQIESPFTDEEIQFILKNTQKIK